VAVVKSAEVRLVVHLASLSWVGFAWWFCLVVLLLGVSVRLLPLTAASGGELDGLVLVMVLDVACNGMVMLLLVLVLVLLLHTPAPAVILPFSCVFPSRCHQQLASSDQFWM
jgi:hypothetical protein